MCGGKLSYSSYDTARAHDSCPGLLMMGVTIFVHRCPDSIASVAGCEFLDAGMKRLQTVDPNEGSNI